MLVGYTWMKFLSFIKKKNCLLVIQKRIASSRIRTDDLVITSDAPYQLGHQGFVFEKNYLVVSYIQMDIFRIKAEFFKISIKFQFFFYFRFLI